MSRRQTPKGKQYWSLKDVRFVKASRHQHIDLTALAATSPDKWRALWAQIKQQQPALAELLKEPGLRRIKEYFDGHITIAKRDLSLPDNTG